MRPACRGIFVNSKFRWNIHGWFELTPRGSWCVVFSQSVSPLYSCEFYYLCTALICFAAISSNVGYLWLYWLYFVLYGFILFIYFFVLTNNGAVTFTRCHLHGRFKHGVRVKRRRGEWCETKWAIHGLCWATGDGDNAFGVQYTRDGSSLLRW